MQLTSALPWFIRKRGAIVTAPDSDEQRHTF